MRHANPDLIFDHELSARSALVLQQLRAGQPLEAPLERVTLFLTDRCNLACSYCNGPHLSRNDHLHHGACNGYLPFATYQRWLAAWARAGLKHLHFTGGEPGLHPQLPAMIRAARAAGVLCSITSNGTLPYRAYARFLRAGLTELRISIDSARPREVDAIVGRPGAGRRLLGNLRALLRLRQKGKRDFWLVLNSCVSGFDAREIYRRLNSLRRLGPDDIKLLVVAQDREKLRTEASRHSIAQLQRAVEAWGAYPLLRRKLQDLFRRDAAGLRDPVVRQVAQTCVVPLLERTIDETGLYPCSIYKRHGGAPIAPADRSLPQQQAAIHAWMAQHDCRKDAICIQHCVGCTRQLNLKANLALRHGGQGLDRPYGTREWWTETPWMLVKPLGVPHLRSILRHLRGRDVRVKGLKAVDGWQALAAQIHAGGDPEAALLSRAYAHLEGGDRALWLELEGPLSFGHLDRLKQELRLLHPGRSARVQTPSRLRTLKAQVVHVPEREDAERERVLILRA